MARAPKKEPQKNWQGRPFTSAVLRLVLFVVPIACSVSASAILVHVLPHALTPGALIARWLCALTVSTLVLIATDRFARRLMPLAVLMQFSLAFPNEAPSRFKVARQAGNVRDLQRVAENARAHGISDEPTQAAEHILQLVAAVESHDRGTRGHSERVRLYTDLLGDELKLSKRERDRLRWAALLHDVGKIMVPPAVLNKPEKLDEDEWHTIHRHPGEGARIAEPLRAWLGEWFSAIEEHHEKFDGSGYPNALSGEGISRAGRIVAVADAFEVMTARRAYRRPMRPAAARAELVACSETHFDPIIVRAFLQISVGRLRIVAGPLAWVAQTPLLRGIQQAATVARTAAAAGGVLILGVAPTFHGPANARPARAENTARTQFMTLFETQGTVSPAVRPSGTTLPKPAPSLPVASPTGDPQPTTTDTPAQDPTPPTPTPQPTPRPRPTEWPSPWVTASPTPEPRPTTTPTPLPKPRPIPTPSPGYARSPTTYPTSDPSPALAK